MFNDTSRYFDDIFTIDNPEFEKYIPDIYPAELQLNKANTSDKDKKEDIWPSPMTKAPTPTEMSKGQSENTNNATKMFD